MQIIKKNNNFINSNLMESVFGNQFRKLRHIEEWFFDKFLRNVTGKTKDRIESVTRQIELFKDSITSPKITGLPYTPKDDLVEKCGSISANNSYILKFTTLLDYIIFLYSRN